MELTPEEYAEKMWLDGEFKKYCHDAFDKVWVGDQHILDVALLMGASFRVENCDGFHIHITGDTMSGKSDGIKAALKFLHPLNVKIGTMSQKYIFHAAKENLIRPCMALMLDDQRLDDETAQLYRGVLTSWKEGTSRGNVINMQAVDQTVPPRTSLIATNIDSIVNDTEDAQDESRFLTIEVRNNPERMRSVRRFIQEPHEDISEQMAVIKMVWEQMPDLVTVEQHTKFDEDIPIREFTRFLTLVRSHALLMGRDKTNDDDVIEIKKLLSYSRPLINATTAAYTKTEMAVMGSVDDTWKSTDVLMKLTGMSYLKITRAINGSRGSFTSPTGGLRAKTKILVRQSRSETENNTWEVRLPGASSSVFSGVATG